ncbi:MAG TPA: pyridoxal phosphate-dependent aminotransferase [Vicinamibacterales bacterium]|nr:pyridoxal phosphate-dependent aminotransferase [Vicinamibacterales bacterium]
MPGRAQQAVQRVTRMDGVQSPIIPVIGAMIRQTPGTISLGQGVVHYGPPQAAVDAVRDALATPTVHGYGDASGYAPLIDAIVRKLQRENLLDVAQGSRIMVTAGANMAFMHAVLAITSPGDEIILPTPFYFNHEMAIEMAGCRVVRVPTDDRYQLRLDALEAAITDRTRAIVTISPNNPSGAVLSEPSLRAVNALCGDRGLFHISDEPYEYFTYGVTHVSPGSFAGAAGHTISMFSLSKAYGFAGWRIGYMVYPDALVSAMLKSQDTILICPTMAAQVGAAAALQVGRSYCDSHVAELASVRDIVLSELSALAPLATVPAADGAFYVLLRVHCDLPPLALAERLIREHRVAVIPGDAFGMSEGCYFRVAYGALQKATVAEGIGRLVAGLRAILG